MGTPNTSLSTLRPDLRDSLEEFNLMADRLGFIGHRVAPAIDVAVQADTFGRIPLEQLLKHPNTSRNSEGGYSRGSWQFTPDTFATAEYGHEQPVDDRNARIYGNYFNAEMIAAELALDAVLRAHEKRIADLLFNPTTWNGAALTTGVGTEWSNPAAVPITNVNAARALIFAGCGFYPNALVITQRQFHNLREVTQVIDRIEASGAGQAAKTGDITAQMLAMVFDVDFVLVAGGAQNTADEGLAASISHLWNDEYAMLCRVATTNNIVEPCVARTFHYSADGSQIGGTMETYRDEKIRGDVVRCRHEVQSKVMYVECAHLLSNITA